MNIPFIECAISVSTVLYICAFFFSLSLDLVSRGIMKPDIVFFGEGLPEIFHESMAKDKDECDLLIVIGSSLKVRPVALIPSKYTMFMVWAYTYPPYSHPPSQMPYTNPLPALTYQTVLDLNAACRSKRTEAYWLFSS